MPIYEYVCRSCGYSFEKKQSFTEDSLKDCPECAQPQLRKIINPAGIVFKGSGWYITDSRAKNKSEDKANNNEESKVAENTTTGAEKTENKDKSETKDKGETKDKVVAKDKGETKDQVSKTATSN